MSSVTRLTLAHLEQAPESAARILQKIDLKEAAGFLADVPARLAAPVLNNMLPLTAAHCLGLLQPERDAAILRQLNFQDMTSLLRLMPQPLRDLIYAELPDTLAKRVRRSLDYAANKVGAWTEPDVPILTTSQTVDDALRFLGECRPVTEVFIESSVDGRYVGVIPVKDLLCVDRDMRLEHLRLENVEPVLNRASLQSVAFLSSWETRSMLPVVGRRANVLGGLSLNNLRRGIREFRESNSDIPNSLAGHLVTALAVTVRGILSLATDVTDTLPQSPQEK